MTLREVAALVGVMALAGVLAWTVQGGRDHGAPDAALHTCAAPAEPGPSLGLMGGLLRDAASPRRSGPEPLVIQAEITPVDVYIGGGGPAVEFPFPRRWINGANCQTEPKIQVFRYNADTYILRQSLCTNFEGPFIYLLFGGQKVLMQDTGAGTSLPLAQTVYGIINQWLDENDLPSIQLVVTHSHAHGDHTKFDSQFIGQPNTVVVGKTASQVASFFGITSWPTQIVAYDLGGRIVDVVPIPGHETSHIALYDRETEIVFTGDSLYPGRLYFPKSQFSTYKASVARLVNFLNDKPVSWVLGTHIEMTKTPFVDFAFGATYHPNEHPLQLTHDHLLELHQALQSFATSPQQPVPFADFILYPL